MSSKWLTATGLGLAVVLLLAVNIFSNAVFTSMRADLTEGKLYTLTEGTKSMLGGLAEPVRLRLFLSEQLATRLPRINSYAKRVRELLGEYERTAGGKLAVEVIDPEPFSPDEDRAVGYGLRGIPLDEESTFYFGLVATGSTDEEKTIAYLTIDREEFLEYDLSRLIYQVANPKQKVVGLMSSLPMTGADPRAAMMGRRPQEWMVLEQMRQLFDVRTLDNNISEIPAEVDVLMVVHPKDLKEPTLYAIDQFVLRGGRALFFVDPHPEADQGPPSVTATTTRAGRGSEISKLFNAWGIELVPGKVVGDLQLATRVQFEHEGRLVMLDYPVWINLPPELYSREDIVTASLIGPLRLGTPGHLLKKDGAGTQLAPLMESTVNAALIGTEKLGIFSDPQDTVRDYKPDGKRYVLAARVTGPAISAFADGAPKGNESKAETESQKAAANEKAASGPEHLAKSKQDINVIVIADSDLLQDAFWVQVQDFLGNRIAIPNAANGALVVNALDNLTGSNDLISIRSRGRFTRPFTRVNALRQEAELRFRQKEQELINRLDETEKKLAELERSKQESATVVLSEAQQQEIARFRQEKIRIRNELRDVRHELRKNIENLEGWLKFANIGMMPILIGIGGVAVGAFQMRRRKKGVRKSADTGSEEDVVDHKRPITILAVATVLVAVTAIVARQETTSTRKYEEKLFPELLGQINNTAEIIGTSKDGLFTLFARDGRWLVKEKHGYPANPDKVHQLLVGLSQLQRIEPKTNNPELYSKIGVEDVSVNGAKSLRITLKSADGQVLADLLVGNRKFSKANPNLQEYFVRVAGEARAWLVEGKISDEKSVLNWLERDVLALDPGRVREVRVTHADGQEVVVQREDPSVADYKLVGLPDDAEVELYTVNSIANSLTNLTLDDVKPAADLSFSGKRPLTVELITFDGLRVNMQSLKDGKQHLARFRAEFDSSSVAPSREGKNENKHAPETGLMKPDAVKKEIDTLNARWGDWVYVIPGYRIDSLTKKKSDLLKVSKGGG